MHLPKFYDTREPKTTQGHMMPPWVHLSDIHCKCFRTGVAMASKKTQWTNRRMKVSLLVVQIDYRSYNSPMSENMLYNSEYIYMKFVNEIFKLT